MSIFKRDTHDAPVHDDLEERGAAAAAVAPSNSEVARQAVRSEGSDRPSGPSADMLSNLVAGIANPPRSAPLPARLGDAPSGALQLKHDESVGLDGEEAHEVAATGLRGAGAELPYRDRIESSFGQNLGDVKAHIGGEAARASDALGAKGYAAGNHVAFREQPDLHTAAHEAAHVVQQRAGVHLKRMGRDGDEYERQADAAADAVVRGESAAPILGGPSSARGGETVVQRKPSAGLDNKSNTKLVQLALRHAASAARQALEDDTDDETRKTLAARTTSRIYMAIESLDIGDASVSRKQLFPAVDSAYVWGASLQQALKDDPSGANLGAALATLFGAMAPSGWKRPANAAAGKKRLARAEKRGGKSKLSASDKSQMAVLHLKGARQHVLSGWDKVTAGDIDDIAQGASNQLVSAHRLMLDPNLLDDAATLKSEVKATSLTVGRLIMHAEEEGLSNDDLVRVAKELDGVLTIAGESPQWEARVPKAKEPPKKPAVGAGKKPAGDEKEPPRAEPAMHRVVETQKYEERVNIKDTNYINEELGHISLTMYAAKTATGQVYVYKAIATKELKGRARSYLSMGADVESHSFNLNGKRYSDVHFDIKIGGPNKTETSGVSIGLSAGIKDRSETLEAGGSASWTHSTSTTSQGTANFRRVYRIDSLSKPITIKQLDLETWKLKDVTTGMVKSEIEKKDFNGFELDDDDVGDGVTTFYANWILHSY